MPELPEVETYRRFFRAHALGRPVRGVEADPAIVRNSTPGALAVALVGRRFEEPGRVGKWLIARTDGPVLLLHFGMTGGLVWSGDEPSRHRHDRLFIRFDEGELRYRNMRKLGGVWLGRGEGEAAQVLRRLGPDALDVGRGEFLRRLAGRRGGVKAVLMDQAFVAGVGNLVADEVLWQARLHPRRAVESLDEAERARLWSVMRRVLRVAVLHDDYVSERRSWLSYIRGGRGARCPRCRAPLARSVAAGRTTYHCPVCQPLGRPGRG